MTCMRPRWCRRGDVADGDRVAGAIVGCWRSMESAAYFHLHKQVIRAMISLNHIIQIENWEGLMYGNL